MRLVGVLLLIASTVLAVPSPARAHNHTHVVTETAAEIAKKYNVSEDIARMYIRAMKIKARVYAVADTENDLRLKLYAEVVEEYARMYLFGESIATGGLDVLNKEVDDEVIIDKTIPLWHKSISALLDTLSQTILESEQLAVITFNACDGSNAKTFDYPVCVSLVTHEPFLRTLEDHVELTREKLGSLLDLAEDILN